MRETIKCMSEICQSSKDKKLSALQVVIVADENGVDSAVEMIKQNRNSGECLVINMCFWNNCWPDKLVTAIAVSLIEGTCCIINTSSFVGDN